jgi:hypothetical protein
MPVTIQRNNVKPQKMCGIVRNAAVKTLNLEMYFDEANTKDHTHFESPCIWHAALIHDPRATKLDDIPKIHRL